MLVHISARLSLARLIFLVCLWLYLPLPECYSKGAARTISRPAEPNPPKPRGKNTVPLEPCAKCERWGDVFLAHRCEEQRAMSTCSVEFDGAPFPQDSMRLDQAFLTPL